MATIKSPAVFWRSIKTLWAKWKCLSLHATRTTGTTFPWLPVELTQRIISLTWYSSVISEDRLALCAALPLVNKTWQACFIHTTSGHVIITSLQEATRFRGLISEDAPSIPPELKDIPNTRCSTLTFRINASSMTHNTDVSAMVDTLKIISRDHYLPNLYRVSVEYIDYSYWCHTPSFPPQVQEFYVSWSSTSATPIPPHNIISDHVCLPGVRKLVLAGAYAITARRFLAMCPNVEEFETSLETGLEIRSSLPPSVKTLWLQVFPGITWTAEQVDRYVKAK